LAHGMQIAFRHSSVIMADSWIDDGILRQFEKNERIIENA
jgi:hypothetical protein